MGQASIATAMAGSKGSSRRGAGEWAAPFREGLADGLPIALGYLAVSFSLGIAAKMAGLSLGQGVLVSFLCNASAGEYAGFTLVAAHAGYLEARRDDARGERPLPAHGCVLSQRFSSDTPLWMRALIAFDNTDEIFAVNIAQRGDVRPARALGPWSCPLLDGQGRRAQDGRQRHHLPPGQALGVARHVPRGVSRPRSLVVAVRLCRQSVSPLWHRWFRPLGRRRTIPAAAAAARCGAGPGSSPFAPACSASRVCRQPLPPPPPLGLAWADRLGRRNLGLLTFVGTLIRRAAAAVLFPVPDVRTFRRDRATTWRSSWDSVDGRLFAVSAFCASSPLSRRHRRGGVAIAWARPAGVPSRSWRSVCLVSPRIPGRSPPRSSPPLLRSFLYYARAAAFRRAPARPCSPWASSSRGWAPACSPCRAPAAPRSSRSRSWHRRSSPRPLKSLAGADRALVEARLLPWGLAWGFSHLSRNLDIQ